MATSNFENNLPCYLHISFFRDVLCPKHVHVAICMSNLRSMWSYCHIINVQANQSVLYITLRSMPTFVCDMLTMYVDFEIKYIVSNLLFISLNIFSTHNPFFLKQLCSTWPRTKRPTTGYSDGKT